MSTYKYCLQISSIKETPRLPRSHSLLPRLLSANPSRHFFTPCSFFSSPTNPSHRLFSLLSLFDLCFDVWGSLDLICDFVWWISTSNLVFGLIWFGMMMFGFGLMFWFVISGFRFDVLICVSFTFDIMICGSNSRLDMMISGSERWFLAHQICHVRLWYDDRFCFLADLICGICLCYDDRFCFLADLICGLIRCSLGPIGGFLASVLIRSWIWSVSFCWSLFWYHDRGSDQWVFVGCRFDMMVLDLIHGLFALFLNANYY